MKVKHFHKKLLSILLAVCLSLSIAPISVLAEGTDAVCKIGEIEHPSLDSALDTILEGESKIIELLTDISYNKGMAITNRSVQFALGKYNLNIVNKEGIGLQVTNGTVGYTGDGEFNVTGTDVGVYVLNSSSAVTVTNAVGTTGYGVNVSAGSIIVNGDVVGATVGAQAANKGEVEIKGDVRALNEDGKGAWAIGDYSTIIIDGSIYAPNYIQIFETVKDNTAGTVDLDKPGYLKYSIESEGTVWVQNTVCAIEGEGVCNLRRCSC